jgi:chaperonin GroES
LPQIEPNTLLGACPPRHAPQSLINHLVGTLTYDLSVLDQSKNIDSSLEPLDEYLVIQPVSDETETRAGLILPASALATVAVRTGIVTAVGSEPNGIERGDKVLYPHEAGFDVRLGGIEVKVLKRSELIGRIHD